MRIAHVITRMIVGGAQENTLFNCLDLLRLYGDDVLLITGPALGPEGDLLRQNDTTGLSVVEIPSLRREIHPWRDWQARWAVQRELTAFQPDVVHTHSAKGGFLGRLAAHALRVPAIVHTVHGAPFHPYQSAVARQLFCQLERYAAGKCHVLVSVADAMTDMLVDAGVAPREKFTTVSSGMEVEPLLAAGATRAEVRAELGFTDEHVVIGKIARLFHLKGHTYVIEAAEQVIREQPQVRFLFIGDGILRDEFERRIADAGLTDHFRFTGLVPPSAIPRLVGAMDVLVHASLREGLARALPQALIAGKPAVSYDIDGAREVVLDGETGFLLPPQSVAPLAEALIRLAADASLRQRLGGNGQRRFTDQFRHETMTRRLREIYQRLLGGATAGDSDSR
ncbi:glycosyltransferase family 4 protein [Lignipirellula cremea]|uniref:Alpha-D-kanosaminyltransferase n=1 Tax=Lignipirellula cremea TaxID=2528010 RepID=A0A518E1R5_9BACT|nr:glycosyltransferase family 4 protein [Lignipirellula cremea]QDU98036.1 Alpha-D-kanosaminyltransferase [Lignipirellula cremea]